MGEDDGDMCEEESEFIAESILGELVQPGDDRHISEPPDLFKEEKD